MPETWPTRLPGKVRWPPPKPQQLKRLQSLLFIVALILSLYWLAGCTPRPLIIQPTPVKEPVTAQPLPEAMPEGWFSHRIREILGAS